MPFKEGEWVLANGRPAFVIYAGSSSVRVRFVGSRNLEFVAFNKVRIYEQVLPEVKQELIDMALDARNYGWFREVEENEEVQSLQR